MFLVHAKVVQDLVKRHQRCISFLHVAKSQNQQKRTVQKAEMSLSFKKIRENIASKNVTFQRIDPKKTGGNLS